MTDARFEILTTADDNRWNEILSEIGKHDFCHLVSYNRIAQMCGHGRALLFTYREADYQMAFPILLRPIDIELPGNEKPLQDVTSVYGYAGPVVNRDDIPEAIGRRFMEAVCDYLRQQRVISMFSRMHPLLDQAGVFDNVGEVVPIGWTLSIDLTLPEEKQFAAYRRNHRQDIKRLREMGITCYQVEPERLSEFIDIYYDNMRRVHASQEYFFTRSYFQHLFSDMSDAANLFMCEYQGKAIAAGIFTLCCGIVQWYLSGSCTDFQGPPPTKLLVEEVRRWAISAGAKVLHLGGGVGAKKDSLFHFKRGFTSREHRYTIWRHIMDQPTYDALVNRVFEHTGLTLQDGYFPLYRHPDLQTVSATSLNATANEQGE